MNEEASKVERTEHFTGVVEIPIGSYLDALGGVRFRLLDRKHPARSHPRAKTPRSDRGGK